MCCRGWRKVYGRWRGDVGMINRERKRACAGVREELGRLAGEYATLVRKNRRLESVVGEMEGS